MILLFHSFLQITAKALHLIEENRRYIGIIGDESNVEVGSAPFFFQSFRQVVSPLLNEAIIA
jgi:hypothetical protein